MEYLIKTAVIAALIFFPLFSIEIDGDAIKSNKLFVALTLLEILSGLVLISSIIGIVIIL